MSGEESVWQAQRGEFADRWIARVGYGAMQLGASGGPAAAERAHVVLRAAVEHGVEHIDTAAFYGAGATNRLIREALAPYRNGLVIATKIGVRWSGTERVPAQRPEELRAGVEDNLRTLGLERLGLVNLRRMDSGRVVATGDQQVDLDDQLAELVRLREEGKIAALGVSDVSADLVARALPAGIVGVQNLYNLLDRTHEPVLRLCRESGIAFVPYFPLGSAVSRLPRVTENATVAEIAGKHGASPAQVAIAWLLALGPHVFPIPGTSTVAHLLDNIGAASVQLDEGDVRALGALAN
ncbi:aldo/keto reductase [Amycolatopsis sp. H20-H5]|uniref:aldo/keto reductase n=1 Tax=Amycolatopsis sp. H20-H5 TaxID=3046309 RepID=UPI002DB7A93D|nr:aldo/keto reductase [Amycolatopsis sp. H20-H5]MEC3975738.1 aldo/keto reductase [Amycolatopsis sp. H20-H5]